MRERKFHHEDLDVYRVALEFVAWVGDLMAGPLKECKLRAVDQLDRASTSSPLNIAEGNGKRSTKDRCRFLDIAHGSALECAACLDVLVARRALQSETTTHGKELLLRIVEMLSRMIDRLSEVPDTRMLGSSPTTSPRTSTTPSPSTSTRASSKISCS